MKRFVRFSQTFDVDGPKVEHYWDCIEMIMMFTHSRAVQQTVSILANKALGATDTVQLIESWTQLRAGV
jgi:hypothetical protein